MCCGRSRVHAQSFHCQHRAGHGPDPAGPDGIFWGTSLGAQYRTRFADLITFARRDWAKSARRWAGLGEGSQREPVAPPREPTMLGWDSEQVGFSPFHQTSLLCNDSASTRDFEQIWRSRQELVPARG
ncbi:hypothetical protein M8C13_19570 [Crossiella sp. SN42]|uniref:hypothetical protein n=1 Tax=Crossiella sp. SN42 TaxID=2944808 RepID=UPI00207C6EC0|nr:hypothetical protein [Crossiella sp. SN42]MCO1577955.1 hypothetical protein [Crossiella sp. SN42]